MCGICRNHVLKWADSFLMIQIYKTKGEEMYSDLFDYLELDRLQAAGGRKILLADGQRYRV